jgi:hypothetical protein
VPGRRGVEDDEVEGALAIDDEIDDSIEECDLDQARRCRGHLDLPMRLLDHRGAEHPLDVPLHALDVSRGLAFPVDLECRHPGEQLAFLRADRALEDIRRGVRRIGGHQENPDAALACGDRKGCRAGRLAHPALAAEEHDLAVEQAVQQHGKLPSGECSMPMRRCHV